MATEKKFRPFENPFRPGAGHYPMYLAGRENEKNEFQRLLYQSTIVENLIISGLRGVGKTVLLETLKPIAIASKWLWVGTDLNESASLSEANIVTRMLADLALVTSSMSIGTAQMATIGFAPGPTVDVTLTYRALMAIYTETPGLPSDKLKAVLHAVSMAIKGTDIRGIVFAYDEAQEMTDHAAKDQYPLSLTLEVFQSIQRSDVPFMLVLTGLPTLMPKLVDARTYSERMFHVMTLDRLNEAESRQAIKKPIEDPKCPVKFSANGIEAIIAASGGYPYFIQFICREIFDAYLQTAGKGIPVSEAVRKLDSDFFMARWSRATDRQKQLLWVVANLEHCDGLFSAQDVSAKSKEILSKPFSTSSVIQMFNTLGESQLIYKNSYGKYCFAVPLLGQFIERQAEMDADWKA
jgi:type II secretory pathway predicted ATPase ExeA